MTSKKNTNNDLIIITYYNSAKILIRNEIVNITVIIIQIGMLI